MCAGLSLDFAYPRKYGKAVAKHHRAYVERWLQHYSIYVVCGVRDVVEFFCLETIRVSDTIQSDLLQRKIHNMLNFFSMFIWMIYILYIQIMIFRYIDLILKIKALIYL